MKGRKWPHYLVRVVWKVDFVEDLGRFVLDGFDFDLVGWVLALAVAQCLLQSLQRVGGDWMAARPQEQRQFLDERKKRIETNEADA